MDCRGKLAELSAQLPPSLIGMESCTGAHEWASRFQALGHTVRLMAPASAAPYRKSGKNDGNDAEAFCEAVSPPNMRFVAVMTLDQQALLTFADSTVLAGARNSKPDHPLPRIYAHSVM
jgi:transposase